MFRRRREPPRRPHPDPLVEAALQRVIAFRRMAEAKEGQIAYDRRQIRKLDRAVRRQRDIDLSDRGYLAETLRREVRELEQDVMELHEAIAGQVSEMDPDHLLWL